MVTPPPPIYWLPAWLVSAGRNEGKWFPRKKCSVPGEPDLLASWAAGPAGNERGKVVPSKTKCGDSWRSRSPGSMASTGLAGKE